MSPSPHDPWITIPRFLRRPPRFFRAQVRRTQEHSPVRQHWEPRAGRISPGTGRKNPGPVASFAPFRGWSITTDTHGSAPRANIFRRLRALCGVCCLRLAAMWGSQSWLPPAFSRRLEFLHFQPSSKPTGSASGLAGSAGGLAAGVLLVVCGKQNGEYALDCGAANPAAAGFQPALGRAAPRAAPPAAPPRPTLPKCRNHYKSLPLEGNFGVQPPSIVPPLAPPNSHVPVGKSPFNGYLFLSIG
jgi:hypothetical protein